MCDQLHHGIGVSPYPHPQQIEPWEKSNAIREQALKLQALQVKHGVLVDDLFKAHPDHTHSPQNIHQAINQTESTIKLNEEEIFKVQQELLSLLGSVGSGFAISIQAGDRTLCLCDEDGYLCARNLISLHDYVDGIGDEHHG